MNRDRSQNNHADWPCSAMSSTIGLAGSGPGGMAGAVAWAVVGDSEILGGCLVLVAVPDPLRGRLQRRSH